MNKIIKLIKNPKRGILYLMDKGYFNWLEDKAYLKIKFKVLMNKKLNLEYPKTFNEKLQWLKLYDRKDIYTTMVDKYEAKKYVSNIIGEKYIIPTLGIYDKFEDIDFDNLPNQFVIKPTHTSGDIFICKDKTKIDKNKLKKIVEKWLKRNYYYLHREWVYKNVKPRIIIEKYMIDNLKKELNDYKFMCFDGKVKCSFVCSDRHSKNGLHIDFFDLDWNKMPFQRHYPKSLEDIPKPHNYRLMIELSEKLSEKIPFIRVDFYEINKMVYFGELTFYPGSGFEEFTPEKYDEILGNMIEIEK